MNKQIIKRHKKLIKKIQIKILTQMMRFKMFFLKKIIIINKIKFNQMEQKIF